MEVFPAVYIKNAKGQAVFTGKLAARAAALKGRGGQVGTHLIGRSTAALAFTPDDPLAMIETFPPGLIGQIFASFSC